MSDLLKAILYGIIEGITEWLPISSTGHLILAEKLIPFENVSNGFFDVFDVIIQLGAILAVVVLFIDKLWPFAFTKKRKNKYDIDTFYIPDTWSLWFKIIVSCVPAGIFGILFDDFFEEHFYNYVSVAVALIFFGVIFIVVENTIGKKGNFKVNDLKNITYMNALQIGIFQILAAAFPGTSRSGITLIGAMMLGISRTVACEYTFFLAVPVMAGASLLKLIKFGFSFTGNEIAILGTGCVVSFIISIFAMKFLLKFIKKNNFKPFGWYRIALGIIVLGVAFLG